MSPYFAIRRSKLLRRTYVVLVAANGETLSHSQTLLGDPRRHVEAVRAAVAAAVVKDERYEPSRTE